MEHQFFITSRIFNLVKASKESMVVWSSLEEIALIWLIDQK